VTITLATAAAALLLAAVAAICDLRSAKIPGWLSWPALVLGPCAWALAGGPWPLGYALISLLACALVPLALFAYGAMGGGDVKLAGALGGLVGARLGLEILLIAFTLVVLVAIGGLVWRGELMATLLRVVGRALPRRRARDAATSSPSDVRPALPEPLRRRVRFAPSVLAGALIALLPELLLRS